MKFGCFHSIDARQNVGVPINWVDAIAFCRGNEREMNGNSFSACIGAGKQRVLSYENPAFDCPLGLVVVDCNVGVFEKSCQRSPVFECVVDRLHQLMGGVEFILCTDDDLSKLLNDWLRISAPYRQSESRRFVLNVPFDLVELAIHIKNGAANILLGELGFKVFAPRVSVAAGFGSAPVLVQRIESAGSVGLNNACKIPKERLVFLKREVRREVEHVQRVRRVSDVCRDFSFANVVLVAAVLNLDGRVVGLDDGRREQFLLHQVVQKRQCICGHLHPVALGGARDGDVVTGEDFFLPIVGKSVVELAHDYFAQKSRAGVATRNRCARFFSSGDVLLAARAGACFLQVIEHLQAGADHFELVGEKVAYEDCFDRAVRTDVCIRFDQMRKRLVRKIFSILENVLDASE